MTNPNPSRITDQMWRLWTEAQLIIPGVRLGGIYANKSGYHNTRLANQQNWPNNYSIKVALDLLGPGDKAAAIDLTMSSAEMRKRTGYLRASALDLNDDRLSGLREFYGTLDGSTVYGLIKDSAHGSWRSSSADSTHLWHIHASILRAYVSLWSILESFISVLSGESYAQWVARRGSGYMLPAKGDEGPVVEYWQRLLIAAGYSLEKDGVYGDETQAVVDKFRVDNGAKAGPQLITPWMAVRLQQKVFQGARGPEGPAGPEGPMGPEGPAGRDGIGVGSTVTIHGTVVASVATQLSE